MARPYRLVTLGRDDAWADALEFHVREATAQVVRHADAVEFARALATAHEDPAAERPHTVVVYLADATSREDPALRATLQTARDRALPVLPITHTGDDIFAILPEVVRPLNAQVWEGAENRAIQAILRLLGLIERERRLFLSYARRETSALAVQLRTRLSERGYDVFLDRFNVPPAADFQRRINIELSDKAFVLLLESPAAVDSKWVQHEVAFAHTHSIALLALSMSETTKFPGVDEAFRYPLAPETLSRSGASRMLRAKPLENVLDEVEARYARQLRLRRVEMLGSVMVWLQKAGVAFAATEDEWSVAADWPSTRRTVFLVTPRSPAPSDLYRLDNLRRQHGADGCLIYASPELDPDDKQLLKWIRGRRPLTTRLHEQVPDLLGLP